MKTNLRLAPLLAAVCTLATLPVTAAIPNGTVVRNVKTTALVDLVPTSAAPAGAAGSAKIKIQQINASQSALIKLQIEGFTAGKYHIVATLTDASVVPVGGFKVSGTGFPIEPGKDDGIVLKKIPASVDATKIASLAIVNANSVSILEGNATVDTVLLNFIAAVSVTGPNPGTFPSAGVRGHAFAHSKILNGAETKRVFLWTAFGAPSNVTLTINVDGAAVGTVTSTIRGQVLINSLDPSVNLTTMHLITLTDGSNAVVMQAQFQ